MLVTICCCIDNRDKWPLNEGTYCIAAIRSSQTMPCITVSRVPMNVMTCGALLCLHVDYISQDKRLVFGACLGLCLIGTFWLELQMKVCETFTITEKRPLVKIFASVSQVGAFSVIVKSSRTFNWSSILSFWQMVNLMSFFTIRYNDQHQVSGGVSRWKCS